MIRVSTCCPVCRAWFYRKAPGQRYCSPVHARVGKALNDNKRRKARARKL